MKVQLVMYPSPIYRSIYLFFVGVLMLLSNSCKHQTSVRLSGALPLDSIYYASLYDAISGQLIAEDTVQDRDFELQLDLVPAGIYTIVFSWNRGLLTPGEMRSYTRYEGMDLPRFELSRRLWIDPKECISFDLSIDSSYDQHHLEEVLLHSAQPVDIEVDAVGENFLMYQMYEDIMKAHADENLREKENLRQMLYSVNESGDLKASRAIHEELSMIWVQGRYDNLVRAEIEFLKQHGNRAPTVYILYSLLKTEDDFNRYRPVYDNLSLKGKEAMKPLVSIWIED